MITSERMKGYYVSEELVTLKEAKSLYPFIKHLEWLEDNVMGYVSLGGGLASYTEFMPVTFNGKQIVLQEGENNG